MSPGVQQVGALGRDVEPQRETRRALEPIHERTGVEIAHRAETDRRHRVSDVEAAVPLDRFLAGRADVAPDLLERRPAPALASSRPRPTPPSTSSAPTVSATCASFGP